MKALLKMNGRNCTKFLLKAIATIFILVGSFSCFASNSETEKEIKEAFGSYKAAIKNNPKSLSKFFSLEIKEGWLEYLFDSQEPNEKLSVLKSIESRASFGRRISKVYEFEVSENGPARAIARIIYKTEKGKGPFTYRLNYTRSNGYWKISHVTSDTTKPGKNYIGKVLIEYE